MRCKQAKKAIFEDGLGLLDSSLREEMERHCSSCATCQEARRSSGILDDSFLVLRSEPVPAIAIHQKVLGRIVAEPLAAPKGFAWATAAAVLSAAGFVTLTFFLAPHVLPVLRGALYGGVALLRSTDPLWNLVTVPIQAGSYMVRPMLSLAETWSRFQPLTFGALIAGSCLVLTMSLVLVGRSFLLDKPVAIRKES